MELLETAIQAEGSVGKLASALDVKQNVVSNWRKRGLPKPWAKLLESIYLKKRQTTRAAKKEKAV
tara:strand:- start:266 stop:460 length:195 start_codon:yes stop_codon:yes gene_type:complete